MQISLVIPMKNEAASLASLMRTIADQTLQPSEIVLVDGGSTDATVEIAEGFASADSRVKLVKTDGATPGKGRNLGITAAANDWLALTDAGIELSPDWLAELVAAAESNPDAAIVYGNFSPITKSLFEKCATLAYVPALRHGQIRAKSVASMLLRREVWDRTGGFPDIRAAEDLMFMEAAEQAGFTFVPAPKAHVYWQLRQGFRETFAKFDLYSERNVAAGRAWDWHYGVLKQYAVLLPFLILSTVFSFWWLAAIPLWLAARTAKRMIGHRDEYGFSPFFKPQIVFVTALIVITIDAATFTGWLRFILKKRPV